MIEMNEIHHREHFTIINLLTYNLFMRPPGIKTNQDDYKNERFQLLKSYIPNYDIICFQELFSTGNFRKQSLIQFAIKNKFFYWKISQAPSFFSGAPVDGGLALISKYPITSSQFKSYKLGILSDSASDKGSLYCKILINNHHLHIFNTHLQATYHNADSEQLKILSIITRLKQFQTLAVRIQQTLLKQKFTDSDLVLIAGDLNTDARKTYYNLDFNEARQFMQRNKIQSNEFNQYHIMKKILKNYGKNQVVDLAFQKFGEHPITFGDGDKILTGSHDTFSNQRLDYIIQIIPETSKSMIKPKVQSCQVQKFFVEHPLVTQLSDHYGLSIQLSL